MQYIMATPAGQIVQQSPMVIQTSVAQQHSTQPVFITQAGAPQLMQSPIPGTPIHMDQPNVQMVSKTYKCVS